MTSLDQMRGLVLFGYVAARLVDGNWHLALLDIGIGVGLLAVFHWLDESRFNPLKN